MEIVVTFLAILDLVRDGSCRLIQEMVFGDLELQKIGSSNSDFKNSFDSSKDAIIITGTPEQGQTLISQSGSDITISTCFEEGCESADFMKNDVSVE